MARPVPPVPVPETVPHPQPRVVWSSERYRVVARDWADGHPATYSVLAQQRGRWQPATGEECWACLISLARWLDGQQQPR